MTVIPISFLIGSGFSKPAGYLLAKEISTRFVGLKADDVTIHSDGAAWFNNGNLGPNHWMRSNDRLLIERLLDYYCTVVATPESFHYETFYDWYKRFERGESTDSRVEDIATNLDSNLASAMLNFDLCFNQLLAQLLRRWYPNVHLCRGLPQSHAVFLDLVEELGKRYILHFHSLNHDLFLESLSSTDAMGGQLADGFSDLGSCHFGRFVDEVQNDKGGDFYSYIVRLPRFVDEFGSRFNLYKLHGSVDQYIYGAGDPTTFRSKRGIGLTDFIREVSENGKLRYEALPGIYHPDFLAGSSYKTSRYGSTPYYRAVFEHFRNNLVNSASLIVIGYGFGDIEINSMISEHFLKKEHARIFVVDIQKPQLPPDFASITEYFDGGISDFDKESLLRSIDLNRQ